MSGDDASHAERVDGPSREPRDGVDDAGEEVARRRRREVGGQVPARRGDAPRGHGGIPGEEARGSDVGSGEASSRHDGAYLAYGRESGSCRIEGVVRARPVVVAVAVAVITVVAVLGRGGGRSDNNIGGVPTTHFGCAFLSHNGYIVDCCVLCHIVIIP